MQRTLAPGMLTPGAEVAAVSFALYVIGYIVFVVGLSIGANMLHIPGRWIAVGDVVLIGLGIMMGVTGTRQRDSSN